MIQSVMQCRYPSDSEAVLEVDGGDCYIVGDAGRHGNSAQLMSVFVDKEGKHVARTVKTLFAHYDEEAYNLSQMLLLLSLLLLLLSFSFSFASFFA